MTMLSVAEITECPHDVPGILAMEGSLHPWPEGFREHLRECVYVRTGQWVHVDPGEPLVSVQEVVLTKPHLPGVDVHDIVDALRARSGGAS